MEPSPQGANWINHDALLPSRARQLGEGRVFTFPFTWSGENTHAARLAAGHELQVARLESVADRP